MRPFTTRKIAARIGTPNRTRNACSKPTPTMPTGIVATISIQASFWSGVVMSRSRSELKNPLMIRSQSRQKYTIMPMAVATCSPTM